MFKCIVSFQSEVELLRKPYHSIKGDNLTFDLVKSYGDMKKYHLNPYSYIMIRLGDIHSLVLQ